MTDVAHETMAGRRPPVLQAIAVGAVAAGPALLILLVARLGGGSPGILELQADVIIRLLPPWLFDWGIQTLGSAAKGSLFGALCLGVPVAGATVAVVLRAARVLGMRRPLLVAVAGAVAMLVIAEVVVMPLVGVGLGGQDLRSDRTSVHAPLVAAALAYGCLLGFASRAWRVKSAPSPQDQMDRLASSRRLFVQRLVAVIGLGAYAGAALAVLSRLSGPPRSVLQGAPDLPGAEGFGFQRAVTPVPEFYFVSKDWVPLEIDRASWRLRVGGLVDVPHDWTLDELRTLPRYEAYRTLQCISAESITRTTIIGNQRWQGVRVQDVLEGARPRPEATYVIWRCADGYHESLDLATAQEDDSWLVYEMGPPGTLLTPAHGAPLRLLVAGRYGMTQPKYLTEMILADHDEPGWWVKAGWHTDAPVRTYCRIDLPAADGISDAVLAGTSFTAYGVASSGDRGISAVQVSTDGGVSWSEAELEPLGPPIGRLAWVRWRAPVTLTTPGTLLFMARAADGTGRWQDVEVEGPFPRGASGYPRVPMRVYPSLADAG